jgi:hypothetical protein
MMSLPVALSHACCCSVEGGAVVAGSVERHRLLVFSSSGVWLAKSRPSNKYTNFGSLLGNFETPVVVSCGCYINIAGRKPVSRRKPSLAPPKRFPGSPCSHRLADGNETYPPTSSSFPAQAPIQFLASLVDRLQA